MSIKEVESHIESMLKNFDFAHQRHVKSFGNQSHDYAGTKIRSCLEIQENGQRILGLIELYGSITGDNEKYLKEKEKVDKISDDFRRSVCSLNSLSYF